MWKLVAVDLAKLIAAIVFVGGWLLFGILIYGHQPL